MPRVFLPLLLTRKPGRSSERGFALLMTVVVLSFLVILLVGLAAYTRIETSVAGNSQRQAQARENALLALNVAVEQLQLHAGPDRRVTATAQALPNGTSTRRYTGVWDAATTEAAPIAWLVSGNELRDADGAPQPLAITPESPMSTANAVALVGTNTSTINNDVLARLVPITVAGVPGLSSTAAPSTIGRYAWWVADQGVKAPVALNDSALGAVTYAPYDSTELQGRLRQQVALGAGPATAAGEAAFEPRTSTPASPTPNATLAANTVLPTQLAFFRNANGTQLGATAARQRFHIWSANNAAVLANTRDGGLRQDLSLRPDLLGAAFAAWADYSTYMETPLAAEGSTLVPPYAEVPVRRRYRMQPAAASSEAVHGVAPVLAVLGLNFSVRARLGSNNTGPLEVRARWQATLWNPYAAALVPEDLRLEVEGLPGGDNPARLTITTPPPTESFVTAVDLDFNRLFEDASTADAPPRPFPMRLDWPAASEPTLADYQSWLPGRVYTWVSQSAEAAPTPAGGMPGVFYTSTEFNLQGPEGDARDLNTPAFPGAFYGSISFPGPRTLTVKLYRVSDGALLGTFISPEFAEVAGTEPKRLGNGDYQFGFQFRLFEPGHVATGDRSEWLTGAAARDFATQTVPATAYRVDARGNDPAQYASIAFSEPNFLFDRQQSGTNLSRSFNEDVPLFELPRSPVLSLGMLQHLHFSGARPFAFGNPAGATLQLGGVEAHASFDRYFFSGLAAPVRAAFTDEMLAEPFTSPLPNSLLQITPRKTGGARTTLGDVLRKPEVTDPPTEADAYSSASLLQRGAFNFNSTESLAWLAVLRGTRFANGATFTHLDADAPSGTSADITRVPEWNDTTEPAPDHAVFFRFSQSAQETYAATQPGTVDVNGTAQTSTYAASPTIDASPAVPSTANTHLFRRGMRTLTAAQTVALANAIATRVSAKLVDSGPFRTTEEFLKPLSLFAQPSADETAPASPSRSLLEAAIVDADINAGIAEFSSQWLTQADVMTALAPVLFPRSDTFLIRTYGEVVNPATGAVEGRAWCEAQVQRLPEYMVPSEPPETLPGSLTEAVNQTHGRRFKIVSFRWLTRSEI